MTEGSVKPHSFVRVKINFTPTVCGNYYERVYCIVRNHKVLFVDLMGTCFDILTKPIPLQQKHVDAYRSKVVMGSHKKTVSKQQEPKGISKGLNLSVLTHDSIDLDASVEEEMPSIETPKFEVNQTTLHKEMM
jgi:hypothetical protein